MAGSNLFTRILITAEDKASAVFSSVSAAAGKLTATIAQVGTGIAAAGAAFSSWVAGKFLSDSVDAAEALEREMGALKGAIEATGGAAGFTAEELDAMARRLDEATLGSASGFRRAAVELLTFKSVGRDVFESTLMLAQDLASAGFGSVESAAVMLGKALEDPIRGLTSLGRVGVTFTEEQKALIKSFAEAGDKAAAQGVILEVVAGQVGGVASAMGSGLAGAIDLVGKRATDLKEQLGQGMIEPLTAVNTKLADFLAKLTESGKVRELGAAIGTAFANAIDVVERWVAAVDWGALVDRISEFATTTGEQLAAWGRALKDLATQTDTALTGMSVAWNAFRGTTQEVASWIVKGFESIGQAGLFLSEQFNKIGLISDEALANTRARVEDLGALYEQISADADVSFERMRAGLDKLSGATEAVVTPTVDLTDVYAEQEAKLQALIMAEEAQAIALGSTKDATVDAMTGIREALAEARAEYERFKAAGDTQGMAETLIRIQELESEIARIGSTAGTTSAEVAEAFKTLGVTSQAELQRMADAAKQAFETIAADGTSAPEDVANAFTAYAEKAIAANNGVADSAIRAKAEQLGLSVAATETGDKIVAAAEKAKGPIEALIALYERQAAAATKAAEATTTAADASVVSAKSALNEEQTKLNLLESEKDLLDSKESLLQAQLAEAEAAGDTNAAYKIQIAIADLAIEKAELQVKIAKQQVEVAKAEVEYAKAQYEAARDKAEAYKDAAEAAEKLAEATLRKAQADDVVTQAEREAISEIEASAAALRGKVIAMEAEAEAAKAAIAEAEALVKVREADVESAEAQVEAAKAAKTATEKLIAAEKSAASATKSYSDSVSELNDGMTALEWQTERVLDKMDELEEQYNNGEIGAADYLAALKRLQASYRLTESGAESLASAIESVESSMESMAASAKDSFRDLQIEWANYTGEIVEAKKLQFEGEMLDAELALIEAKRNGNAEEIEFLEKKINLLHQYHAAQLEEAAKQEAEAKIAQAQSEAEEQVRKASLSQAERDYENAIQSLQDQLAQAILNNDKRLQEALLNQIIAENIRHDTTMANIQEETAARIAAAEASEAASSTASRSTATNTGTTPVRTVNVNIQTPSGDSGTVRVLEGDEDTLERLLRTLESGKAAT